METRRFPRGFRRSLVMLGLALTALVVSGFAQDGPTGDAQPPTPDPKATFFDHSQTSKWWFSGQANFVFQAHGDFYAQYSGTNSFTHPAEHATSRVLSIWDVGSASVRRCSAARRDENWRRACRATESSLKRMDHLRWWMDVPPFLGTST